MEIGLGPHEFDCSGFVLRALADVCGTDVQAIDPSLRHSRQIWQDAKDEQRLFVPTQETVGALAVFQYRWDTAAGRRFVPAHIAIVSAVSVDGPTRVVHSKSSEGRVVETPLNRSRLLGFVAVRPDALMATMRERHDQLRQKVSVGGN